MDDIKDIEWGSFSRTAQTYGYKKDELIDFAEDVIKNPKRFRTITKKRAYFYINILAKHKK